MRLGSGVPLSVYGFAALRVIEKDGNPWFVASEVCEVLGVDNVPQVVGRLDEDEKLLSTLHIAGQNRQVSIINESGLYSIVLTSRKPEAKRFNKWVTSEVLPERVVNTKADETPINRSWHEHLQGGGDIWITYLLIGYNGSCENVILKDKE